MSKTKAKVELEKKEPVADVVTPTLNFLRELSPSLRKSDLKAMKLLNIDDPAKALEDAYKRNEVLFVGTIDGHPVCAVSVIPKPANPYGTNEGSIWLVANDEFKAFPFTVAKKSKEIFDKLLLSFPIVDTVIDRSDETAKKYALFLGFEDWGEHYDTTIGEAKLGYFRREYNKGAV